MRDFAPRTVLTLGNIIARACHQLYKSSRYIFSLLCFFGAAASAQAPPPQVLTPRPPPASPAAPSRLPGPPPRPNAPPPGEWEVRALISQEIDGPWRRARGTKEIPAEMESSEMLFQAVEIDYNSETGYVEARGAVHFQHFTRGEELRADRMEYNLDAETGKFYNVKGWGTPRIDARPGVLTSTNPFYFEGEWAERLGKRYVLHDGFVTNCRIPNPWWRLKGPRFDIIPGERAIAYRTTFAVRGVPIFYTPMFYKSLERLPRRSGFLMPNLGNSSRRGKMIGIGYYWAINRSYDATYRIQDFTDRGFAHHVDLRGKPRRGSDFNLVFYGVQDRGYKLESGERIPQGGFTLNMTGESNLGHGFMARGQVNYLSSLLFRQAFTESFNEAIFSEVHSVGFITRHWSYYSFNTVFARLENFQSSLPGDAVVVRKLPEFDFAVREKPILKDLPLWFSLTSTAGLLRRNQPLFQTRQFTERADIAPRITTALRWKDFHLIPSLTLRQTHYGERRQEGRVTGENINRSSREVDVDLILPSLARVYNSKGWFGEKLKHVIETRGSFRHVGGIDDFSRLIRFDEAELLSNTTHAEFSLTNRLYAKRRGLVQEVVSWQLWQRRYFDEDFGGAVTAGRRNVVTAASELTPYAFLDGPRRYSPVVSVLRITPLALLGTEWRADYDPLRGGIVNSGFSADARISRIFVSAGHNQVHSTTVLTPNANQFRGLIGFGEPNKRGWNAAFTAIYDYRIGTMQFATTQVTYNTDCCGLSVQYRRFSFGTRNENQFRLSFAVANLGTFGTLKKQERLF